MAHQETVELAKRAREAALQLSACSAEKRDAALAAVRQALIDSKDAILAANKADKDAAEKEVAAGKMSSALLKRLDLVGPKFEAVLQGIDEVKALADPVGKVTLSTRLSDGLDMYRVSCPIGVICMIFEARPEAAVQIASLTIKSANAVILKGGKEAQKSNDALIAAIRAGLARVEGFPVDAVQLVHGREEIATLLGLDRYIDLVIPRGSNSLVRYIQDNTRIPVLGHADGICSVYLDEGAEALGDLPAKVVVDAKTQYPAACNAAETLLVHRSLLNTLLPKVASALHAAKVELRADPECLAAIQAAGLPAKPAQDGDFDFEFLDHVMAVKSVASVQEAAAHINAHGSHHTDSIVSPSSERAEFFMSRVDSAGVYHNCSTRFADGQRPSRGELPQL
eukprot:tig00020553_g10759.t1